MLLYVEHLETQNRALAHVTSMECVARYLVLRLLAGCVRVMPNGGCARLPLLQVVDARLHTSAVLFAVSEEQSGKAPYHHLSTIGNRKCTADYETI
jgi:hypothetical protein